MGRVRLAADRRRGSEFAALAEILGDFRSSLGESIASSAFTLTSSENGFGFQRKIAPNQHKFGNGRPVGRLFRWQRAAQTSGFSGGS